MTNRAMKDSVVDWIGEIPETWNVGKVKNAFFRKKEKANISNPTVLSLARSGIKVRDITNNEGQLAANYNNYNPVSKGDVLLNPMDLVSGANCNISKIEGVISPAYVNLKDLDNYDGEYYIYYFKLQYWSYAFFAHGKGVSYENRWTLNNETIMNYPIPIPPHEEQQKIAAFLDEKVAHIDNIIEDTKKSIENLKSYKQSLITETVTKGLDPNLEMKDSGIEWIGDIPKHWTVTKVKNFVYIKNGKDNKAKDGEIPVYGSGGVFGKTNQIMYEKPSVLLGRKGTIDSPKYVETPFWAVDTTFYTVVKPNVFLKFFYYVMKSLDYRKYIYGSAIPSMSQSILNEIKLPYTNKAEQKQIAEFLDEKSRTIETTIKLKEQLIAELESYKKSMIYEYVTGKKEVN